MLARPIIATAVGGNVEIIHDGETGLLVKAQDESDLRMAMERLYSDKKLRDTLGENARKQYEERFDFDHIVRESFIPLYKGPSL
jgi:glycosyltransferase involved in cell wall biosynthesis